MEYAVLFGDFYEAILLFAQSEILGGCEEMSAVARIDALDEMLLTRIFRVEDHVNACAVECDGIE